MLTMVHTQPFRHLQYPVKFVEFLTGLTGFGLNREKQPGIEWFLLHWVPTHLPQVAVPWDEALKSSPDPPFSALPKAKREIKAQQGPEPQNSQI